MKLLLIALMTVIGTASAADKSLDQFRADARKPKRADKSETTQRRLDWWREAKFGMFIHWGIYAVPAGVYKGKESNPGEWVQNRCRIPVSEYAELAGQFNPGQFDADLWMQLAADAGMKYVIITAKHHDGFAMFKTTASDFNIMDATPFKRDVIKEISDACRKRGMKFGVYYSQAQDWHHPGGLSWHGPWDPAQAGDTDEYIDKVAVPQLRELLTHYGPVSILWFDTPQFFNPSALARDKTGITPVRAQRLAETLKLQPGIIINNRLGGGIHGDTDTPEQSIPARGYPGRDWETCMTMNNTWGFKKDDQNWKSTETLLRNLVDIASKGGNYLLNVGPTAEGLIPQPSIDRLKQIGQWMKINGEAIYGTTATPFGAEAGSFDPRKKEKNGKPVFTPSWEWRCTAKPGKLYIHLFRWPAGKFELPAVKSRVSKATLLAVPGEKVEVKQTGSGVSLSLPAQAPDPIVSVVCLDIEDEKNAPGLPAKRAK